MAATKIILKRSSLQGKRPNTSNLEAGELAVNTNATEPGLFFEVTDGQIVKVGPTAYMSPAPTDFPAKGELWVDGDTKTLSIGNDTNGWQKVAAPFLGGTQALTVFVAPDFPEATDSLDNDGQAVPFVTINRAVLEVTKKIILDANNHISNGNNRYLIILAPGSHCVINGPGATLGSFSVNYDEVLLPSTGVTQASLQQFNVPEFGGLILPRGVSIIGMDLKKSEVHPVYVPKYTHPAFPENYSQVPNGPVYQNQPLSSIFRWTGNTYVSNFNNLDKLVDRVVDKVRVDTTGAAIFGTSRPHGLDFNDFVQVSYTNTADQAGATFANGAYYAIPVNSFEFQLSKTPNSLGVLASTLPDKFLPPGAKISPKLQVSNIYPYYVPLDGVSYELSNYSHHRLSVFKNCALEELNDFYQKVQLAFPTLFGNVVNRNVAILPEYQIVADAQTLYPQNLETNSVSNSSPYANQVNHRSNYGMANVDADGDIVTGFKSVIINSATAVILQKDPCAYEIYAKSSQDWRTLTATAQARLGAPIYSIKTDYQLQILNETSIPNLRYYYTTLRVPTGESSGLTDIDNDFRHFGFRGRGAEMYIQAQSTYSIGAAIGVWAMGGAFINLTNATTNFGSTAFQSEGFAGIGTLGGATQVGQGFLQSGVVRPLSLTETQVISDTQKKILTLGSRVVHIGDDPTNAEVILIYLRQAFDPASILPFSLRPGSAVFFGDSECTYTAYFVDNGEPTCILSETDPLKNPYAPNGAILRVRKSDSNLPTSGVSDTTFPYIRRFIDPRTDTERCYGLYVESSNASSQAPQLGSVLRLNQVGKDLSTAFKRNYQFDPGKFGGIAQTFTVNQVETAQYNFSLNYNNKVSDNSQSTGYAIYASLSDNSGPWIQSYLVNGTQVPYNTPEGTYITNNFRNYYAAENNLWRALYYRTPFNAENGPTKVSPDKGDSPFVTAAVMEKQENIRDAWQGYVPDPLLPYYLDDVPDAYNVDMTYLRGTVIPAKEFFGDFVIDEDNGSSSLGIIFYDEPVIATDTVLTTSSSVVQSGQPMTSPFVTNPSFGRPEIIKFTVLKVSQLGNPKNELSVVRLSNSTGAFEYLRVIGLSSNVVTAIRHFYPTKESVGNLPPTWPAGTKITRCISSGTPQPSVYDPIWSITKNTILRYYEVMGFRRSLMEPLLVPQYAGERVLYNSTLQFSPINGYANRAAPWPVEFNAPSTIIATSHTWTYAGYFDYSRGLPKYQTNQLSRKLTADYQSFATWGGRVTCFGAGETGAMVLSGDFREAFTLNYFQNNTPLQNFSNRVVYASPVPIDTYPSSVLVYSAGDITSLFNGVQLSFDLKRGDFPIPSSQLTANGILVFLGGVAQIPGVAYTITNGNQIQFAEAPLAGTACDIRIITTDDGNETLEVVRFSTGVPFNGSTTSFPLTPGATSLNNGNSLVFLGGVLQDPLGPPVQTDYAYTIEHSQDITTLSFIGAAPLKGTTLDVRGVLSGSVYRTAGVPIVFMASTDEISDQFDGAKSAFELTRGGISLDAGKVNAENILVNLGGVMQIPIANSGSPNSGLTYTVNLNTVSQVLEITFTVPPTFGTTCNIRTITQDEFITCPLPGILLDRNLKSGPGVETNFEGQLIGLNEGFI